MMDRPAERSPISCPACRSKAEASFGGLLVCGRCGCIATVTPLATPWATPGPIPRHGEGDLWQAPAADAALAPQQSASHPRQSAPRKARARAVSTSAPASPPTVGIGAGLSRRSAPAPAGDARRSPKRGAPTRKAKQVASPRRVKPLAPARKAKRTSARPSKGAVPLRSRTHGRAALRSGPLGDSRVAA